MQLKTHQQGQEVPAPHNRKSNPLGKIVAIVLIGFAAFVLLVTLAVNSAYDDMRPHDQKLVKALKDDLLSGHWNLEKTRNTAEQNAQDSREKLKQSTKKVEEADRAYQQALAEQKQSVAAAAKRKAKKAATEGDSPPTGLGGDPKPSMKTND